MYLVLCFSAGVGRAGTFCIIYSAICELNGTGNIGKNTTMRNNNYLLFVFVFFSNVFPIGIFMRGIVKYLSLWVSGCVFCTCHPLFVRWSVVLYFLFQWTFLNLSEPLGSTASLLYRKRYIELFPLIFFLFLSTINGFLVFLFFRNSMNSVTGRFFFTQASLSS